ncbi:TPA: hypothetical protein SMM80_002778 [Proteus mirabilis]|nr:hypothetical protein [Proteus mirabilis]HCL6187310.1 hypothetical protein [Proteus mirabilis]HEJ9399167.1 hypothetical protein [Proteus mirabilis]
MFRYLFFVLFFFSAFSHSLVKDYIQPDSSFNISEYDSGNGFWQQFRGYYNNSDLNMSGWHCYKSDNPVSFTYNKKIKDELNYEFSPYFSVLYTETVCHVDWDEDKEKYFIQDKYNKAEMYFTYSLYFCPERKMFTNNSMNKIEGCPLPPNGGLDKYCLEQPSILNALSSNTWREEDNVFINYNGCKYEAYGVLVSSNNEYVADWRPVGKSDPNYSSGSLANKKPIDPSEPNGNGNGNGNGNSSDDIKEIAKDVSEINTNIKNTNNKSVDIFELLDSKYKNVSWDEEQNIYKSIDEDFSLNGSLSNNIMDSISDYYANDFLDALNGGALNNLNSFYLKYSYGLTDVTKTRSLGVIANSVGSGVESLDFGDDYNKYFSQTDFYHHFDFINSLLPQYKQCQPLEFFEGVYGFTLSCFDIEKIRAVLFYVFFFYTAWFIFTKFSTLLTSKD